MASAALKSALTPATGYEASIYLNTPLITLCGIIVGILISTRILLGNKYDANLLAYFLGILSLSVLVFLPLIRDYYFLGEFDALTHLGHANNLANAVVGYTDLLYPGMHSASVILSIISNFKLSHSLLFVIFWMSLMFVTFVPLLVRDITENSLATTIAFISAMMLLPLNAVKLPILQPIPTSVAVFYLPCVFYAYITVSRGGDKRSRIVLLITMAMLVLLHPQQALAFGVFLVASEVYDYVRPSNDKSKESKARTIGSLSTIFLLLISFVWLSSHTAFLKELLRVLAFLATLSVGAGVTNASDASSVAGTNLIVLFVKVFLIDAVYLLLVAAYAISGVHSHVTDSLSRVTTNLNGSTVATARIILIGLMPVGMLISIFILSGEPKQYFRYIGTAMVFITILGALMLWKLMELATSFSSTNHAINVFKVGLVAMLVLSMAIVHPSPYISKPTNHISESQIQGYETSFKYAETETEFIDLYSPVDRYRDAIFGRQRSRTGERVPTIAASDKRSDVQTLNPPKLLAKGALSSQYESNKYMTISAIDRYRAIKQYSNDRLSRQDFQSLQYNPKIDKINTNGGFKLYLVE